VLILPVLLGVGMGVSMADLIRDWNPIKAESRQFTDLYLCSKLHIVLCGRAAFIYDEWINEKGDKEIIKTGTKMRVESDFGYEPSFLFEMERIQPETDRRKSAARSGLIGQPC